MVHIDVRWVSKNEATRRARCFRVLFRVFEVFAAGGGTAATREWVLKIPPTQLVDAPYST